MPQTGRRPGFKPYQEILEVFVMLKGFGFRVAGLVLGIIGATVSATAIVFSSIGMIKARPRREKK